MVRIWWTEFGRNAPEVALVSRKSSSLNHGSVDFLAEVFHPMHWFPTDRGFFLYSAQGQCATFRASEL